MTTLPRTSDTATRRADDTAEPTTGRVPWSSLSACARELHRQIMEYRPAPARRRRRHRWKGHPKGYPPGTRLMGQPLLCSLIGRKSRRTASRLARELVEGGWLLIIRHPRTKVDDRWCSLDVQGYLPLAKPPRAAAKKRNGPGHSPARPNGTFASRPRLTPSEQRRPQGPPAERLGPLGPTDAEPDTDSGRPPDPLDKLRCSHGRINGAELAADLTSVGGCLRCEAELGPAVAAIRATQAGKPPEPDQRMAAFMAGARLGRVRERDRRRRF